MHPLKLRKMNHFTVNLGSINSDKKSFSFNIKGKFFDTFPSSEVRHADISAIATLSKNIDKISLHLVIAGKIHRLPCDICTENLSLEISAETNMIIKKTNEKLFSSDEIYYIQKTDNEINLKQLIFELIVLNIPKKRKHPLSKEGNSTCNKEMIELVNKYTQKERQSSDPRWDALKVLK